MEQETPDYFYLCDGLACPICDPFGYCRHTSDPAHARNQRRVMAFGPDGNYWETEGEET